MTELTIEDYKRFWRNLSEDGKEQAFMILTVYPEKFRGDNKKYIEKQVEEFKKFYSFPETEK